MRLRQLRAENATGAGKKVVRAGVKLLAGIEDGSRVGVGWRKGK